MGGAIALGVIFLAFSAAAGACYQEESRCCDGMSCFNESTCCSGACCPRANSTCIDHVCMPTTCLFRAAGKVFDLTPLSSLGNEVTDTTAPRHPHGFYAVDPCGPLLENRSFVCRGYSGCSFVSKEVSFPLGGWPPVAVSYSRKAGLQVQYANGSCCGVGCPRRYSYNITFECHRDNDTLSVVDDKGCNVAFRWATRHVCETSPPSEVPVSVVVCAVLAGVGVTVSAAIFTRKQWGRSRSNSYKAMPDTPVRGTRPLGTRDSLAWTPVTLPPSPADNPDWPSAA